MKTFSILKYLLITISIFATFSCSKQVMKLHIDADDSLFYNLDSIEFIKKSNINNSYVDIDKFKNRFYAAWTTTKAPRKSEILWGGNFYSKMKIYGENRKRHDSTFVQNIVKNSNVHSYPSLNIPAITVDFCDIKVIPTIKPLFYSFEKAGEGFPFDNNENSTLWPNTPVKIVHKSVDGRWYFITSSVCVGWVEATKLAFVSDEIINHFIKNQLIVVTDDNVSIYRNDNKYMHQAMIGSVYPIDDAGHIFSIAKNENDSAILCEITIDSSLTSSLPIEATERNIKSSLQKLLGNKYGWGGYLENRDCSATLRDLFTMYGLLLPRKSKFQKNYGNYISFENLTIEEKRALIREKAIPYKTLLYKVGHIMLYVGSDMNRSYMFHNAWGLKTTDEDGNHGRLEIGKTVITDVEIGKDIPLVNHSMLEDMKGMTILFEEKK